MTTKSRAALSPRESGDYIAEHSDHVSVNEDGIKLAAKMVSKCTVQVMYWCNVKVLSLVSVTFSMPV